jgi:chromate reductase
MSVFDRIGEFPLFNSDVQRSRMPEVAQDLRQQIRAADAVLIATPEYNFGVPGVLKNAIDWTSQPVMEAPLRFKPVAIMGASGSLMGTVRAQLSLRLTLQFLESYVLPKPEVLVTQSRTKFDEAGTLTDQATIEHVQQLVVALVAWAHRVKE